MTNAGKRTILYIDDDDDDRMMVREAIKELDEDFELLESSGGAEGLHLLHEAAAAARMPCLVLLDLNMPGMNGRDTLLAIKGEGELSEVPVVVFTTSSSLLDKTFCSRFGVEMITKPFSFESLTNLMQNILCRC